MTTLADACAGLAAAGATAAPWLAPYRARGRGVALDVLAGMPVHQALNAALRSAPVPMPGERRLRFVAQSELPGAEAYEAFIARTACVPTRDNPHDLFNGLVWLTYAPLKRHLNALQAQQIAQRGIGPTRGAVRDALTLFDENGAWWQAPAVLVDALRRRDWHALFIHHRAAWQDSRLTLFGHALLEKLTQPRKAITAHVWPVPEGVDAQDLLLRTLDPAALAGGPCLALPVLGVPQWWPANQQPGFYDDTRIFRPAADAGGALQHQGL